MRTVRTAFAILVIALLCSGYAASQWAYFHGDAAGYAQRVDVPAVRTLALVILVGAILLAFIRDREQEESKDS